MTFSDYDLKRFHAEYDEMGSEKIDALIARLEAAESYIQAKQANPYSSDRAVECYKAWRKAAGK